MPLHTHTPQAVSDPGEVQAPAVDRSLARSAPGFVYGIFVSLFVFFNVFALNQWLQYRAVGRWRDYLFGENVYIVLSLTAKSALAWQVFGGTKVTFTEWMRMDLRYIRSRSLWTDLRLIVLTVPSVIRRDGVSCRPRRATWRASGRSAQRDCGSPARHRVSRGDAARR